MTSFITVTLNPALDLTGQLEHLTVGEVNRVQNAYLQPAGKGVNGAQVLADLGGSVMLTGFLGSDNAAPFHQLCQDRDFSDQFIELHGSTRINVKLAESSSQVTDINFPGFVASPQQLEHINEVLARNCGPNSYVIIAGSLPRGLAENAYQSLITTARERGATVLFDSSGAAFTAGLAAQPTLIKPNREELAEWIGHELSDDQALTDAALTLLRQGIRHVVVSDGSAGVYWFSEHGCLHAQPPRVNVVSTVGAGDTLVAGFAYGLATMTDPQSLLRLATALSAQAVTQVGVGCSEKQQLNRLQQQVQLTLRPDLLSEGAL